MNTYQKNEPRGATLSSKCFKNRTLKQGKLNMISRFFKQSLCLHQNTRGVTMIIETNEKIVRCVDCDHTFVTDSIQEARNDHYFR